MSAKQALVQAIIDLRQRGKTIVLITHRTSVIGVTTKLLLLRDGVVQMFGPTDEVLAALTEQAQKAALAQQRRRPRRQRRKQAQRRAAQARSK